MQYDEIQIQKDGDNLTITFLYKGKRLFSYYYDLPDGDTLSLIKLSGIANAVSTDS